MTKDEALRMALDALEKLFGIPDMLTGENSGDVAVWRMGGSYRTQQAITAIKEALAQPKPVELDITIDDDDALAYLRDMVVQSDGDLNPIRLVVWRGHSGYGLYIASADYPEEGAIKIADVAATPPAAHQLWVGLTNEEIEKVWGGIRANEYHDCVRPFALAIEAKLRSKNND